MNPFDLSMTLIQDCGLREISVSFSWQPTGFTLLFVQNGELHIKMHERVLTGSVILFFSKESVHFICNEKTTVFFLIFKPEILIDYNGNASLLHTPYEMQSEIWKSEMQREIQHAYNIILLQEQSPEISLHTLEVSASLCHILSLLVSSAAESPSSAAQKDTPGIKLFHDVNTYMHQFYNASITQAGTAGQFHISPQYLSRILKQSAGMTFRKYQNVIRQEMISLYRDNTFLSEEEILQHTSPDCFPVHHFNSFLSRQLPGRDLTDILPKSAPAPSAAPGTSGWTVKTISTSLQFTKSFSKCWKQLINLGYASDLQNLQLNDTLLDIQTMVGFTYGRICRILDLVLLFNIADRKIQDFSEVFSLLDVLISNHMTPFLELGNKAFTIQETNTVSFEPDSPMDSASYYARLLDLLPDFLATCINHYGQEEVDTWRFEVSYMYTGAEKDHFSFTQYAQTFRRIQNIIRSFSEKCMIGGPGYNRWNQPSHIHRALALLNSYHAIPDFLTVYAYPVDGVIENDVAVSDDPDISIRRLECFIKEAKFICPNTEIWVTEFNSNLSSRNYLNDSAYQAVYLARNLAAAAQLGVNAMGYYLLSDAPLRYSDSMNFLFGGWGLYTDSGLPKASCQCYDIFSKLGRYLIKASDSFLITANSIGSFQLLFTHYRHMCHKFCIQNTTPEDLLYPDSVFLQSDHEDYHVHICGIASGTYAIREYIIDSSNANLFHEWQKAGCLPSVHPNMLKDFQVLSSIQPRITLMTVNPEQSIQFTVPMDHMQIHFYSVELYSSGIDLPKIP